MSASGERDGAEEDESIVVATMMRDIYNRMSHSKKDMADKPVLGEIEMEGADPKPEPPKRCSSKDVKSEEEIKKALDKHFSNPYTLCINAGVRGCPKSMPKKLVIMMLKWVFVTTQLLLFGYNRLEFATFLDRNKIALNNLIMKNWLTQYETMPYPHATGIYAVYSQDMLVEYVNYTILKAQQLPWLGVGSFYVHHQDNESLVPVTMCITSFIKGTFDRSKLEVSLYTEKQEECWILKTEEDLQTYDIQYQIQKYMQSEYNLVRLMKVTLDFRFDSIHVNNRGFGMPTKCFTINNRVKFDNMDINGQIAISLKTSIDEYQCTVRGEDTNTETLKNSALVVIVCILSILSLMVCCVSLKKSLLLCWQTKKFFKATQPEELSRQGTWEIVKMRDMFMIASDILNLVGSIIKLRLDSQTLSSTSSLFDTCGIILGSGSFLVWLGILRFLAYDKGFNLLFSVMERSFLPILRFLACAFLFFFAFSLSGWVVLNPYHIKFTTIMRTVRCFFALALGDEIYVTMNTITDVSDSVMIYNDFIIAIYLVLFALIAMNIIIAIFNSTYENIRVRNEEVLMSDLMAFMGRKPLL